jgi:hypothetical protein
MPPEAINMGLFVIEEAIKEAPALYAEIKSIFTKGDPTPDDWTALRAKVSAKSYGDYVPQSAIQPS